MTDDDSFWMQIGFWSLFAFIYISLFVSVLSSNMSGLQCLASEKIWFDKHRYDEAEKQFYEGANGRSTHQQQVVLAHVLFNPSVLHVLMQPKKKA